MFQRVQELDVIQKNAREAELRREAELCREKAIRGEKVLYVTDDADSDDVVRASSQFFPSHVEEKFIALHTSMSMMANRLNKLDHTLEKQGEANHHMMKNLEDNLAQGFCEIINSLNQMPAAFSVAKAALMADPKTALVGAIGSAQSRGGGQFLQCTLQLSQPPPQQSNLSSQNNNMSHVSLNNPPPSRAENFEFKEVGHFARQCPRRVKSDHLNWEHLEPQQ